MKETIKYLKGELSEITIESQNINFATDLFIPMEFTIFFRYVIKNRLGKIVAVGTVIKDDRKLELLLAKVKRGFPHTIFYQTSNGQLWLLKQNGSEETIDKQTLVLELKGQDPLLKTEDEILIEDLRNRLETTEKELKKLTIEKNESIDNLEWQQNELNKESEKKDLIIQRFQALEKERISFELDKLESKTKFIQQAIDVFNPSPENQWVDTFYGKNASDKVQTSKWTNNSKIKRSVNFFGQSWFLKVDLYDWDSELRCYWLSESRYFEYSMKKNEFIRIDDNKQIPYWLILELDS
jgi:hypothetical protein